MQMLASILLLSLALCCYEDPIRTIQRILSVQADAVACPTFIAESTANLLATESVFRASLSKYGAPPEAVEAKLRVKRCTDKMSLDKRILFGKVLAEVVLRTCTL